MSLVGRRRRPEEETANGAGDHQRNLQGQLEWKDGGSKRDEPSHDARSSSGADQKNFVKSAHNFRIVNVPTSPKSLEVGIELLNDPPNVDQPCFPPAKPDDADVRAWAHEYLDAPSSKSR